MKYFYDLHIHSCLSPCGDNDSTPDSIAGMGELNGLNVMALTDHNTVKNCPAFFKAAARHGIIAIAGMELTTAEDIHMICLFPTLEKALQFGELVDTRRLLIKNRTDIFGEQYIMDDEDNIIGTDENLLSVATTITLDEAPSIVESFGGICYPAHIDRQSNGLISVLGDFPESPVFSTAEVHDREKAEQLADKYGKKIVISSDAHCLWDIKEQEDFFELDCDSEECAEQIINELRSTV